MSETIVNKIKKSVQSGTGLTCLYGSLDDINVQMGSQTDFPVAFFVLLNTGNLNTETSNYRERVDVAMFFVKPTEFDFESIENEAIISECKQCAFQWLNSLFLGGDLRYITTLNTSRVYNQMDDILTGYALRVRLEELVGECAPEPFKTTCKVTASANDPTMGTVTGGGEYEIGKPVTLTASWDGDRVNFISWTVNGVVVSTESTYTFTAEEDVTVVGNFAMDYLTFTVLEDYTGNNSIGWAGTYPNLEYSKNSGGWTAFTEPITDLNEGDTVRFRNNGNDWVATSSSSHFSTTTPQRYNLSGNIMSLLDNTLQSTTMIDSCFSYLFAHCSVLSAAELKLPAMELTSGCYQSMFVDCMYMTTPPELPATTMANNCYNGMFNYCNSLETTPVLNSNALSMGCYGSMFSSCGRITSITVAFTYWQSGSRQFTNFWTMGVGQSGTFRCPRSLPVEYGTSRIPTGWTVEYID